MGMCASVHLLGFCRFSWNSRTSSRTRNIRLSCNTMILCCTLLLHCKPYCSCKVGNYDIIIVKFSGREGVSSFPLYETLLLLGISSGFICSQQQTWFWPTKHKLEKKASLCSNSQPQGLMNPMTIKSAIVRILWGNCQLSEPNMSSGGHKLPTNKQLCAANSSKTQHPTPKQCPESFNPHYMKALPLLWSSSYVE